MLMYDDDDDDDDDDDNNNNKKSACYRKSSPGSTPKISRVNDVMGMGGYFSRNPAVSM